MYIHVAEVLQLYILYRLIVDSFYKSQSLRMCLEKAGCKTMITFPKTLNKFTYLLIFRIKVPINSYRLKLSIRVFIVFTLLIGNLCSYQYFVWCFPANQPGRKESLQ